MADSSRWKFIVEEDHYTLLIYETSVEDEGLYECVAVNKNGKATCSARLVVQGTLDRCLSSHGQEGRQWWTVSIDYGSRTKP